MFSILQGQILVAKIRGNNLGAMIHAVSIRGIQHPRALRATQRHASGINTSASRPLSSAITSPIPLTSDAEINVSFGPSGGAMLSNQVSRDPYVLNVTHSESSERSQSSRSESVGGGGSRKE